MCVDFLLKFFELELPVVGTDYPANVDAKSDLKLILEIATNSRLKQGQDKKNENKQIFYCRSLGKDCFKIQVQFKEDNSSYKIIDDYTKMRHKQGCQKHGEAPTVIKIYNLMMLKRGLIQQFMEKNELNQASPQNILQKISGEKGQYFYCSAVQDLQSRRKLKKRFDNIVNISIKKKKGIGLDQVKTPTFIRKQTSLSKGKDQDKINEDDKQNYKQKRRRLKKQPSQKQQKCKDKLKPKYDKFKFYEEQYAKPSKRVKLESNSSIFLNRISQQDQIKPNNPSQIFAPVNKMDSIFHEEQQDYFKKGSNLNIALNMLNEAGSQHYWPQSDNSIGQAGNHGDRMRIDDIFASIRNSLLRSLQKKSLVQIQASIPQTNNNISINNDLSSMINQNYENNLNYP